MKFSLANLLLIALVLAVCCAWWVDHVRLQRYEEADRIRLVLESREVYGFYPQGLDSNVSFKLDEILNNRDSFASHYLNLLTVFRERENISDSILLKVTVQRTLEKLACEDIEDLRELLLRKKWGLQIPLQTESPEGKEFEQFIEQVMKRRF
jgi:hypothetical protein